MKIILLGYMSSGKSTVGKKLSQRLYIPFIDLDSYIEKKEKSSVKDIFKEKGEIFFRLLEHKYLKELIASNKKFVLSLGGGTPCYSNNMEYLTKNSDIISIYLHASILTIVNRLKYNKNRPLITGIKENKLSDFVSKHLFERSFFYNKATYKVSVDNKTVEKIVTEIRIILA